MPWRKRTIAVVGPEAPVTHREIRRMMLLLVIPLCAITLVTSVGAGALAYHEGAQRAHDSAQRSRDNAAAICSAEWQRFQGREGIRTHFMNELSRVLVVTGAHDPTRTALLAAEQKQIDADLPSYPPPTCPNPHP